MLVYWVRERRKFRQGMGMVKVRVRIRAALSRLLPFE